MLTEAQALTIVSLDSMKTELRIPLTEVEHDLTPQEPDSLTRSNFVVEVNRRCTRRTATTLVRSADAFRHRSAKFTTDYRELSQRTSTAFEAWMRPVQNRTREVE